MPKGGFRTTVILNWFLLAACIHPSIGKSDSPALGDPDFPLISLDPTVVLHKASSYVIGINRNHVPVTFRNGLAKLEKMKELTPVWGQRRILYRNGHGPTDGRMDYNYMTGYHFEATFGSNSSYPFDAKAPYPYDDLRNALWEAQVMGADQLHVINFGTGDPEEAGRYVGYLNGSADPLRTDHPIPRQDVGLFELGNEITWDKVRGHDPYALTVAAYATRGKAFAQKMRPRSGVPIKIGMSLSVNTSFTASHWATPPAQALQTMLDIMGDDLDFITFHGYCGWPMKVPYPGSQAPAADRLKFLESIFSQLAYGGRIIETQLAPVIRQHNGDHGRDVFLLNSEFFTDLYRDPALSRGQFGALFSAATAVQAFRNDIRGAVNFCFSHGDMGDSLMFLGEDPTRVTAVFQFLRLLAGHWGDNILQTSAANIPSKTFVNNGQTVVVPRLQFCGAVGGGKLFLLVVNVLSESAVTAGIRLPAPPSSSVAYELSGPEGYFADTAQVALKVNSRPRLEAYTFPPASITLFEILP